MVADCGKTKTWKRVYTPLRRAIIAVPAYRYKLSIAGH